MADVNDNFLLREYAERDSESAFTELVERHVNFVYSVAVRYVGNPPDAQDVTQAVFVILAKKSADLCRRTTLTGWLYETTRLTSRQLMRGRARRLAREQEAYMQSTLNPSGGEPLWLQLAPHLEEAMSRLRAADRELLALRFYQNKTGAEAAALLGIGAAAAHKRTDRALEKLRVFFQHRGISTTTDAISRTMAANWIQVAPAGMAKTISAVALAKGAAASTSTLTLVKGALKVMAWTKAKTVATAAIATVMALSVSTTAIIFATSGGPKKVTFRAYVDGREVVKISDNRLWIEHLEFRLPEKIRVNDEKWNPTWNNDTSTTYKLPRAFRPASPENIELIKQQGRGDVSIAEEPTPDNNETLTIKLDDGPYGGAAWYEFTVWW